MGPLMLGRTQMRPCLVCLGEREVCQLLGGRADETPGCGFETKDMDTHLLIRFLDQCPHGVEGVEARSSMAEEAPHSTARGCQAHPWCLVKELCAWGVIRTDCLDDEENKEESD